VLGNLSTLVVGGRRPFPVSSLLDPSLRADSLDEALIGRRDFFDDGWRSAPVYSRERLPTDATIEGPAVIQQVDATTVLEPGSRARIDGVGNLRIEVGA
jgi:N-methylhydantoinase A